MSATTTTSRTIRTISRAFTGQDRARPPVRRRARLPCGRFEARSSEQDVARPQMGADLALDALQRVVDRLGVAAEPFADRLVAAAVEVQREHARLEVGERGGQAADERAQLLGGDDLVDRVVDRRAGQDLVERRLAVADGGRRRGERDVLVQRLVLVARRRLHRGDDLPRDAQLREVAEARLAVGAVVADRLVEADEALLDQVVAVAAGQEVRRRLEAHEAVVAAHETLVRRRVALLGERDEVPVFYLDLTLRPCGDTCHERSFPNRVEWYCSVAHSSPGADCVWGMTEAQPLVE